jgi:hypothetical protein
MENPIPENVVNFPAPQKLVETLTTSASRVNEIHFSGSSTLSICRAIRRADREENRECACLDSISMASYLYL